MSIDCFIFQFLSLVIVSSGIPPKYEVLTCRSNEFFDVQALSCVECDPSKNLQPSNDRGSCSCDENSILIGWESNLIPICRKCPENHAPSRDKKFCVGCDTLENFRENKQCKTCDKSSVVVDREINGEPLSSSKCIACSRGTQPSEDFSVCTSCHWTMPNCSCPSSSHEVFNRVICVSKSVLSKWPKASENFDVLYEKDRSIQSEYFYNNLYNLLYGCQMGENLSCQGLANICVLNHYEDSTKNGPCRLLREQGRRKNDYSPHWIFFEEAETSHVLRRTDIMTKFKLHSLSEGSELHFRVSKWSLNGTWLGFSEAVSELQLCPSTETIGVRFATEYLNECNLTPRHILQRVNVFFDLYLEISENNRTFLYPVPILNLNYKSSNKFVNKRLDSSQWLLTRRIFLSETVGGKRLGSKDNYPSVVRYAKSLRLRVQVRSGENEDKIYPPVLIISYGELTRDQIELNEPVKVTFSSSFYRSQSIKQSIDIALGVLCGLSVVWSCIRCWCQAHRSGQENIDIVTIINLLVIASGHLSNVFFLVVSGTALHSFIYFKGQSAPHVLLPSNELTYTVRTYVIVAFPLKVCEILAMIWRQMNVDVFLVDWEQPRVKNQMNSSVSAWRTYFVANEWNEIQTVRKTSLILQLAATTFLLKVCGLENWALSEPELHNTINGNSRFCPHNPVFRFAMGVLVYCLLYAVQCVFMVGLYERYVKNPIQEFVDVCSLANISVFILSLCNFGHYIHGRSAHGFSDTDLGTLRNQLQREAEDLVGHRGLLPASDHQTFQLLIPKKLRSIYTSLIHPATDLEPSHTGAGTSRKPLTGKFSSLNLDRTMQSYVSMNHFLAAFIEHALKEFDYEVRDKTFIEALLDIEWYDFSIKGVLFYDNGHSFDSVLYYGNESVLFTFDLIVFSFFEIMFNDFLLASIITGIFSEVLASIRRIGGRKNLARKTLIDEHFLI